MSVLVSTVFNNVGVVLNDIAHVRWTTTELLAWADEAQVELVKIKPDAATRTVSLPLVAGPRQNVPTDAVDVVAIDRNTDGAVVTPCDRSALDRFNPQWMITKQTVSVKHWMPDGNSDKFLVYPPNNGTGAIELTYSYIPPPLSAGGTLGVKDEYASRIEDYLCYRALSKDAETGHAERAVAYLTSFKS